LYSALRENTANALNETQCHTNRCVFKSRRNWWGPTAGSRKLSGREFQTVGPAMAKARAPKVLQRTRGTMSWRWARRIWTTGYHQPRSFSPTPLSQNLHITSSFTEPLRCDIYYKIVDYVS